MSQPNPTFVSVADLAPGVAAEGPRVLPGDAVSGGSVGGPGATQPGAKRGETA